MAIIPVKEWVPDAADYGNPGSIAITNAFPGVNSYVPFPSFVKKTNSLGARPRGAIQALDDSSAVNNYVGDASALYKLNGATWENVSKSGGYNTGDEELWEFVRWKDKIIATNFDDNPQIVDFGGSDFADLTTAFKARHVAVVRDFVVFGNTNDASDGDVRYRVRWSAFNDETDYTVNPTTGADARDLIVGGGIQRIIGGQYGVIVSEKSTFLMAWAGGAPTWFEISEVLPGIGTRVPGSVVRLGDTVFFISEQGFVALTGGTSVAYPGAGKVDAFIRGDLDEEHLHRVSAAADPKSGRVLWAYPGSGNTDGRPNKLIVYDTVLNKWSLVEQELELIWQSAIAATTIDELDDFALGDELVTNGEFTADANWTKGTGWAIGSGDATHSAGTASDLEQDISITNNVWYRVGFDVTGRTAGSVTPKIGGRSGTAISADQLDIKETIRASSGGDVVFSATSDFDGSIDNVSVREATSLDDIEGSLDDAQWKKRGATLAGFNSSFQSGDFSGSALAATIDTTEVELHAGRRTRLNSFRPLVDSGAVTARVGTRSTLSDPVVFGSPLFQSASGRFTTRASARYHRFRLNVSGDWTDIIGVQIDQEDALRAERRG